MTRLKYDWVKLKSEFFKSDYGEVKWFFSDKWVIYNSRIASNTKWRTKEKKEIMELAIDKAKEKLVEETARSIEIDVWTLKAIKKTLIYDVANNRKKPENWKSSDTWNYYKIIKWELREPVNITKLEAEVKKEEWLTEEDKMLLDSLDFDGDKWENESE